MTDNAHADAGYDTKRTSARSPNDRPARGRRDGGTRGRRDDSGDDEQTMADVSHTNPHTGESFGDTVAYERGPTVVVDGGEAGAVPDPEADDDTDTDDAEAHLDADDAETHAEDDEQETMGDVPHTPPYDAPDPNAVHMRGGEGDDEDEE